MELKYWITIMLAGIILTFYLGVGRLANLEDGKTVPRHQRVWSWLLIGFGCVESLLFALYMVGFASYRWALRLLLALTVMGEVVQLIQAKIPGSRNPHP